MLRILLLTVLICAAYGCHKIEVTSVPQKIMELGSNTRINDISIINDSIWIACGGQRNTEGYFFKTTDRGKNWSMTKTIFPRSVYCLAFMDSLNGFAGGDYLDLWRTRDGGTTWEFYWLGNQVPFNEEDRPGVRNIQLLNDSNWYFCGGENLGEGVVYHSSDAGIHWDYEFRQHEYRALDFFSTQEGIVAGHGNAMMIHNDITTLENSEFKNDFMTSIQCMNNTKAIGVSYDGGIFQTSDRGKSWQQIQKQNTLFSVRVNWNDLASDGEKLIAVGNYGMIGRSTDNGSTWTFEKLENEANLYSVIRSGNLILATSDQGRIFQLSSE